MTIAIETEQRTSEERMAVLDLLRTMRVQVERAEPVFEDGFAKLSRKHDITLGVNDVSYESLKIGAQCHAPRLAITIEGKAAGTMPEDPFAKTMALFDLAISISEIEPVPPRDDAVGLAMIVSHELKEHEASISVHRPTFVGGVPHLELASIKSPTKGLFLRPPRVMGNEFEPIFRRLDLIASRLAGRIDPALSCQWQALPGGGRTFVARTSKASAMWRADRQDAVAALRMHADWADVMAA